MISEVTRMRDMAAWLRSIKQDVQAQEMEEYAKLMETYKNGYDAAMRIVKSTYPDKFPDTYFICGEGGEKDKNNLPAYIHICPAYGVDWFQLYQRVNEAHGPEW